VEMVFVSFHNKFVRLIENVKPKTNLLFL
jgi:hypothetical protein